MSDNSLKPTSRTDWDRLAKMEDEDIDYTDIPPLTEAFFARARLILPNTVELDHDVISWFQQQGTNYSEQINQILRNYIAIQEH